MQFLAWVSHLNEIIVPLGVSSSFCKQKGMAFVRSLYSFPCIERLDSREILFVPIVDILFQDLDMVDANVMVRGFGMVFDC